jgi:hypothetical protein
VSHCGRIPEAEAYDPSHGVRVHVFPLPACWEVPRDEPTGQRIAPAAYFNATRHGAACYSNWYEGNGGELGVRGTPPTFTQAAPALLGCARACCEVVM